MSLRIISGERHAVNARLLELAASEPSLVVDCANCADPHAVARFAEAEVLDDIFVIEVDVLYKLRDVLLRLLTLPRQTILVTTFDALFHYQNDEENLDVYRQAWLLLRRLGAQSDVVVGVRAGSAQERLAQEVLHGAYRAEPAASA